MGPEDPEGFVEEGNGLELTHSHGGDEDPPVQRRMSPRKRKTSRQDLSISSRKRIDGYVARARG